MIQNENSPTLCPRCEHFTKPFGEPGCKLIPWDVNPATNIVHRWMCAQNDETSWEHIGVCPRFEWNGSMPMYPRYYSGEQSPGGRMSIGEWLGRLGNSSVRADIARIVQGQERE